MLAAMELAVTAVREDRIDPLVDLTARAFVDEQLLSWPLGDHPDSLAVMRAEFRGLHSAAARLGCLWQAGDAAGVASWIAPDASDAFWQQLMSWNDGVASQADDGGARYEVVWDWVLGRYPDERHWALDSIAVDPAMRRAGVGGTLIRHGLAMADADGSPAILETTRPHLVPYYGTFGFAVYDEGNTPGGGPYVWFMRREPA
jgi:ribosomal protein S18 acetylase RimI-like enzyme